MCQPFTNKNNQGQIHGRSLKHKQEYHADRCKETGGCHSATETYWMTPSRDITYLTGCKLGKGHVLINNTSSSLERGGKANKAHCKQVWTLFSPPLLVRVCVRRSKHLNEKLHRERGRESPPALFLEGKGRKRRGRHPILFPPPWDAPN